MIDIFNQIAIYSGYLLWASLIFFTSLILIQEINLIIHDKKKLKELQIPFFWLQRRILDKPINTNKKICFLLWRDYNNGLGLNHEIYTITNILVKDYNIIMVLEPNNKDLNKKYLKNKLHYIKDISGSKVNYIINDLPKNTCRKVIRDKHEVLFYYEYNEK